MKVCVSTPVPGTPPDRQRAHAERMLARAKDRHRQAAKLLEKWKLRFAELDRAGVAARQSQAVGGRAFRDRYPLTVNGSPRPSLESKSSRHWQRRNPHCVAFGDHLPRMGPALKILAVCLTVALCAWPKATERRFASGVANVTHHPQMGTAGKRGSLLAFTKVNSFSMSNLDKSRLQLFTRGSRRKRIGYSGVNRLNAKLLSPEVRSRRLDDL